MGNHTIFQSFEWEMEADGGFYNRLSALAVDLAARGIDAVWLPPVCKATSDQDVGYGVYDLFDLGEFDQKGSVRTKYGDKKTLLKCIEALKSSGIKIYMDVVLNHKGGADGTELFQAVPVNPENRNESTGEARDIEGWTYFNFPGRRGKYSAFEWHFNHFSGVDYDNKSGEKGIFRIQGADKGWAWGVSNEKGNFDYLMFADIDHACEDVRQELFYWADWFVEQTGCDGFRMDAVKHIDDRFMRDFTAHIKEKQGDHFYIFGEYWDPSTDNNANYLEETAFGMDLFDVALHFKFVEAANNADFDLRTLWDNTVVSRFPQNAVTFVDNHDTQPGQSLQSFVPRHFKERAYALILLRQDGYPCVFAGDYYGISKGPQAQENLQYDINRLLELRQNLAYGPQQDYYVDAQLMGWLRKGSAEHPGLLAVVLSLHSEGSIEMCFGPEHAGRKLHDYLDRCKDEIVLDENGCASFPVNAGSLSCWASHLEKSYQNEETGLKGIKERREEVFLEPGQ